MTDRVIKPERLREGDTVGIISPSYLTNPDDITADVKRLEELGFRVKLAKHVFSNADGYAGSVAERAEDFNDMIADDSVKMLLFGGGEVCNEILPYIDYDNIVSHPKIILSFSDSTTILDAVNSKTGLVTFYGAAVHTFGYISEYNLRSFRSRIMSTDTVYEANSEWKTVRPGKAEGILTGGYLINYAALQCVPYYKYDKSRKNLVFLEDHECFSSPCVVSKWLAVLEQAGIFDAATGLVLGLYSDNPHPEIGEIIRRVGERHDIPVVWCEDFGHGGNNSIFPIGIKAGFDTSAENVFRMYESGVC